MRFLALACGLLLVAGSVTAGSVRSQTTAHKRETVEQKSVSSESTESSFQSAQTFKSGSGPTRINQAQIDDALQIINKLNANKGQGNVGSQAPILISPQVKPGSSQLSFNTANNNYNNQHQNFASSSFGSNGFGSNSGVIQGAVQSRRTVEFKDTNIKPLVHEAKTIEVGPNQGQLNLLFKSRSNGLFDTFSQQPYAGRPQTSVFYSTAQEKPNQLVQTVHKPIVREYAQYLRPVTYTTNVVGPVQPVVATATQGRPVAQVQAQTQFQAFQPQPAQFQTFQSIQPAQAFNVNNNAFGQQQQTSYLAQNQLASPSSTFPQFSIPAPKPLNSYSQQSQFKVHNTNKNPWEAAKEILGPNAFATFQSNTVQSKPLNFVKQTTTHVQAPTVTQWTSQKSHSDQHQFESTSTTSEQSSSTLTSTSSSFSPSIQAILNKFPGNSHNTYISNVQTNVKPGAAHIILSPKPGSAQVTRVDFDIPVQKLTQNQHRYHLPVQTTRLQQFGSTPIQVPTNRVVHQQPLVFPGVQTNLVQQQPAFQQQVVQQKQVQPLVQSQSQVDIPVIHHHSHLQPHVVKHQSVNQQQVNDVPVIHHHTHLQPHVIHPQPILGQVVGQQQVIPTFQQFQQFVPQFQTRRTVQVRPLVTETTLITPHSVQKLDNSATSQQASVTASQVVQPQVNVQSLTQNQNSYLLSNQATQQQQNQQEQIGGQEQQVAVQVAQPLVVPQSNVQTTITTINAPGLTGNKVERKYTHSETTEENEETSSEENTSSSGYATSSGNPQLAPIAPVAVPAAEESLDVTSGNTVDTAESTLDQESSQDNLNLKQSSVEYSAQPVALVPIAPVEVPVEVPVEEAPVESPVVSGGSVLTTNNSESRDESTEESSSSDSSQSNYSSNQQPVAPLPLSPQDEQIEQKYLTTEDEVDSSKKKKK